MRANLVATCITITMILIAGCQINKKTDNTPFSMEQMYRHPASYQIMTDMYNRQFSTWPSPGKSYFVSGSFGRTHVLEWNKENADTLILLHGAMGNVMLWGEDCIRQLNRNFHLIAIETIGDNVGLSEPKYWPIERDSLKVWFLELLDSMKIDKVNLSGFSFGEWMALDFASSHPERVNKLMLIGASGFATPKKSFMVKMLFLTLRNSDKSLRKAYSLLHNPGYQPKEDNFVYFKTVFHNCRQATQYPRRFQPEELAKIVVPTVVIIGKDECFFNVKEAEKWIQQHVSHSNVIVLEGAGHFIQIERPDTVCSIIENFYNRK
jgi:pimeloyl-ACP methyl ester carboxylesterase